MSENQEKGLLQLRSTNAWERYAPKDELVLPAPPVDLGVEDPYESPCQEAQRITVPGGARHDNYGHPLDDYTRTAALWTALLAHKLKPGEAVSPQDAIRCMIAVKLSRDVHRPKRDNRVDIAGYANCLQFADEEAERRAKASG